MNIVRLAGAEVGYGERLLLHNASLNLHSGERVVLVGRNGAGKSTLLKVLTGEIRLDDGERWVADHLRISYLGQAVPEPLDKTIYEVVVDGLGDLGHLLAAYQQTAQSVDADSTRALTRLAELEAQILELGGWNIESRVEGVIDHLRLPRDLGMRSCSGGQRRRAMLAQALVSDPDLLLLDEPTNHMDIEAIDHLQGLLLSMDATLVLVTHDRALIDAVATRIVEVDRGNLISYPGNYKTYLARRQKAAEEQDVENRKFDKNLAQEEAWIREGIKARRTRNEGRVRRLQQLRRERAERLEQQGNVKLQIENSRRSGSLVAELENVSFGFDTPIIEDFSTTISRQDRIGIIGPNGSGKSTLIRLLLGELTPTEGKVTLGTNLQIAYFDQQRAVLEPRQTVRDCVAPGTDHIEINGKRKHVVGYLADFLFPSHYLNVPVGQLSGGEKNRLLMAKLFAKPANFLVLDEPTNDLDVETLELLEELLAAFEGTILLVSHDRTFLDAVVTSTIVFEGGGRVREYVGGYSDWQRQIRKIEAPKTSNKTASTVPANKSRNTTTRKLGYKEQRELERLPDLIEAAEAKLLALQRQVGEPAFYQQDEQAVKTALQQLESTSVEIEAAYARWESLSDADSRTAT